MSYGRIRPLNGTPGNVLHFRQPIKKDRFWLGFSIGLGISSFIFTILAQVL